MKIVLDTVSKGPALPTMSLTFETGTATVVGVETAKRPTVLGLVASGRMRPDSGSVRVDGSVAYGIIRTAIALVDAPDVSDPSPAVTLAGVTAEELMFAGRSANPWEVMRVLEGFGFQDYARRSMGDLPPAVRIRVLAELALLREGVRGLVLVSPDRHGGAPADWAELARELAERGLAVLVIVGHASAFADAVPPIPAGVIAAGSLESAADTAAIANFPPRSITGPQPDLRSAGDGGSDGGDGGDSGRGGGGDSGDDSAPHPEAPSPTATTATTATPDATPEKTHS